MTGTKTDVKMETSDLESTSLHQHLLKSDSAYVPPLNPTSLNDSPVTSQDQMTVRSEVKLEKVGKPRPSNLTIE